MTSQSSRRSARTWRSSSEDEPEDAEVLGRLAQAAAALGIALPGTDSHRELEADPELLLTDLAESLEPASPAAPLRVASDGAAAAPAGGAEAALQAPAPDEGAIRMHLDLAVAYLEMARPGEALQQLRQIPASRLEDPGVIHLRVLCARELGASAEAEALLHRALARRDLDPEAMLVLMQALADVQPGGATLGEGRV